MKSELAQSLNTHKTDFKTSFHMCLHIVKQVNTCVEYALYLKGFLMSTTKSSYKIKKSMHY